MHTNLKISLENLNFTYTQNSTKSLQNVNLAVKKGELVLLTGKSGSGKSSLTACINGLIPNFYKGDLLGICRLDTKQIGDFKSYELAQEVGSIFQDPRSQFFTRDTLSELVFSCENFGISREEIQTRMHKLVENLGISNLLGRNLFDLSSGEKQKLAIASVLMLEPSVLLFDEPSANLDYATCMDLAKILAFLKTAGHTIIIAEHRMFYLKNLVDAMYYIDNGQIVHSFSSDEFLKLSHTQLQELGLRSLDLWQLEPQAPLHFASISSKNTAPQTQTQTQIIKAENLSFAYNKKNPLFINANFAINSGDIVALIGQNATGKTTLAKVLTGLLKATSGKIFMAGKNIQRKKLKHHISFIMQDADYQLFTENLEQELTIGNDKITNLTAKIESALKKLDLYNLRHKHPAALSGGEKQRLTIAQAFVRNSDLMILDEPTSGLDAQNMQRLTDICLEVAAKDKGILIITHDYEFILKSCNKILYINPDKTLEYFDFNQTTKNKVADIFNSMQKSIK